MAWWDDVSRWARSNPFDFPEIKSPELPDWFPKISGRDMFRNKRPTKAIMRPRESFPTSTGLGARNPLQQPMQDSLGPLYESLLGMLTGSVGVDEADLMRQVRGALDPIYNERIATARETAGEGKEDIRGMYRALASDYERLAPEQAEQAAEAQQQVEDLYGELRTNIEGNYARIAEEQGDLFKQLGIEAAAPEVLNPQSEQAVAAMNRAEELGTQQQQRYMDIGNIDETYYREGAPLASLTSANRVSDLMGQLQNFVGATEAERTAGIQSSYTQLLGQAQNRAAQMQAQQQGMLFDILQGQLQAQSAGQDVEMTPDLFLSSLPPELAAEVGSNFRAIERSPEAIYGAVEDPRHPVPGTYRTLTDEWWFNKVDEMYEKGQLSEAGRQALMQFLRLRM